MTGPPITKAVVGQPGVFDRQTVAAWLSTLWSPAQRARGTTLLEMLVALALTGLLLVGMLSLWRATQVAYLESNELASLQQNVRVAYQRLTRESRLAGVDPCDFTPGGGITAASATSITVNYTVGDVATLDCSAPPAAQTVTYSYDAPSQTLQRDDGGGPQPLASQIQALQFQYLECDGTPALLDTQARRDKIARISVLITTQESQGSQSLVRTLTSEVRLRSVPCNATL